MGYGRNAKDPTVSATTHRPRASATTLQASRQLLVSSTILPALGIAGRGRGLPIPRAVLISWSRTWRFSTRNPDNIVAVIPVIGVELDFGRCAGAMQNATRKPTPSISAGPAGPAARQY
jgi:hypothetical protein